MTATAERGPLPEEVPVLVVGGGPVGLAAALFLARHGVRVLLVERRATTSPLPRATHVTRRTMELFREAGLQRRIRAAGFEVVPADDPRAESDRTLPRTVYDVRSLAEIRHGAVLETGEEELAVPGPCPPYWCGQDRLEPILRDAAARLGADIRFGHELVELAVTRTSATASVRCGRSGRVRTVTARYVVAADGARGTVGRRLGIPYTGLGVTGHRLTILFRADLDRLVAGHRFFMAMIGNPGFHGAVMRLNDPHRWAAAVDRDPDRAVEFTDARCLQLARAAVGDDTVDVRLDRTFRWTAEHRVAGRYRRGPVFLAGDAAHLHPPSGGYGSNVGFQDAHNLAWKLAAVLAGRAGEDLLDTYDAERRPVAAATAEQALLLDGVPPERLGGARPCDPRTLIMGYRYRSTAVLGGSFEGPLPPVFDLSGEPGSRVPHATAWTRAGAATTTLDAPGGGFAVFSADPGWLAAATRVRRALGVPVAGYRLEPADWCGPASRGVVLVRPDGFVAWRRTGPGPPRCDALAAAVRAVLSASGVPAVHQ